MDRNGALCFWLFFYLSFALFMLFMVTSDPYCFPGPRRGIRQKVWFRWKAMLVLVGGEDTILS